VSCRRMSLAQWPAPGCMDVFAARLPNRRPRRFGPGETVLAANTFAPHISRGAAECVYHATLSAAGSWRLLYALVVVVVLAANRSDGCGAER
jgi:hypothetical protein